MARPQNCQPNFHSHSSNANLHIAAVLTLFCLTHCLPCVLRFTRLMYVDMWFPCGCRAATTRFSLAKTIKNKTTPDRCAAHARVQHRQFLLKLPHTMPLAALACLEAQV